MATRDLPSPDLLRKLLDYDPATGVLAWRERGAEHFRSGTAGAEKIAAMWNTKYAGKRAGATNSEGYVILRVKDISLKAHRVAWVLFYGDWPAQQIDHLDHDRTNNRICNLREVSSKQNNNNRSASGANTSGTMGVCWRGDKRRWVGYITVSGKQIYLGAFVAKSDAIAARKDAEARYGFHTNHGLPGQVGAE